MNSKKLLLEPIFDGEAELASAFDKMVRAKLIEYIEEVEVEIVWNFGDASATGLAIAVTPRCGGVEEISNKLPISLFPFADLLDEWLERIEDEAEEEASAQRRLAWIEGAKRDLDAATDRIRRARAKAAGEEKARDEFRRLFDEKYPHLSYDQYRQQRDAAEAELRAELANVAARPATGEE